MTDIKLEKLIEKGNAYVSGNDVYFDSQSDSEYGKLSHHNMDELEAGARIDVSKIKKHPFDFALWKGKKEEGDGRGEKTHVCSCHKGGETTVPY